ncbi:MAG: hypothetical protein L6R41_006519 [Letrouitia leprolyta]|nr:MAG: hypothetical protein L6R41_006519 [Letrouitia leprolyta]
MAWVRPKHPKPKPKADPVETLVPMLSYFSNRRIASRPSSPTKQVVTTTPISKDPILRSLQQAQQLHAQEHISDAEEDIAEEIESDHRSRMQVSVHSKAEQRQERHARSTQPSVTHRPREPSPPAPPPPPRITRQKPRVSSYERYRPAEKQQERYVPRHVPYPTYGERITPRAISARWASATTPLDLR